MFLKTTRDFRQTKNLRSVVVPKRNEAKKSAVDTALVWLYKDNYNNDI